MIQIERYGVKEDGNTVVETSTYIEVQPDHPLATQIEGYPGWWGRISVGNSLTLMAAKPVSKEKFLEAKEEHRLRVDAIQEELEQRRERRQQEIESKKVKIKQELEKLGLSSDTVDAIVRQVQEA